MNTGVYSYYFNSNKLLKPASLQPPGDDAISRQPSLV
jgi:hypothetical protein